jgi:glyoxylase-like metal-dependent hydrolase (beta-lactamase superfamily II)
MSSSLIPGQLVTLAPGIRRLIAPNPGVFTGPGTNSYLIGHKRVAILDPGPAIPAHIEGLVAATRGVEVVAVAVTHTHIDHSPAAAPLAQALGVPTIGRVARFAIGQDPSFTPDRVALDGFCIPTDAGDLLAIGTPGHASNHVCWHHPQAAILYTGDHILGTTSPVIQPPDGDMAEYLRALDALARLPDLTVAPAHGPLLPHSHGVIAALIEHRLQRERRVFTSVQVNGPVALDDLVLRVYSDVDPALHAIARFSLEAHLLKLQSDGRVICVHGQWSTL